MTNGYKVPEGLKLYPFQREDIDRMKDMPNVLLFSECGVGKTIVTMVHIAENHLYPALVLCPTSLKLNWYDEIEKWTGEQPYYCETVDELVDGYFKSIELKIQGEKSPNWYILHHEALAYVYEDDPVRQLITKIKWKSVILDESHRFRNSLTNRTATLMSMNKEGTKYIFVSGTPVVNSTLDYFFMLKIIGMVDDEGRFLEHYVRGRTTQYGFQAMGSKNTEELLAKLAPIYIRRTKAEVLKDLPPKTYQKIRLTMPPDQREVYDHFEEMMCILLDEGETLTSTNILSLTTRLRQLSLDPTIIGKATKSSKVNAILELIDQNPKEKWVVATTSKVFCEHLAEKLPGSLTLTGDDKSGMERQSIIYKFQKHPGYKVLITTVFTGGVGLNLQVANNLIVADYWWNKMTLDQQVDRVHRIGQDKPVTIYELINEDSIDGDMLAKMEAKEAMANEVVVEQATIKAIYERRRGYGYIAPEKQKDLVPDLDTGT